MNIYLEVYVLWKQLVSNSYGRHPRGYVSSLSLAVFCAEGQQTNECILHTQDAKSCACIRSATWITNLYLLVYSVLVRWSY